MSVRPASIARPLRVIGVIDLRAGVAVHARGGLRERYQPIGDAVDLARRYVERDGLSEIYVADLDAIENAARPFQGRRGPAEGPALHAIQNIARLARVWLDAGVSSVDRARHAADVGASRVVVGLETLTSFETLAEICEAVGGPHVAFSLDLKDGAPLGIGRPPEGGPHTAESADALAARAAEAGAGAIIVLDLARVGMRAGVDLDLLRRVREAAPGVELIAGGGVRDSDDLARLADAGCDAALVATALHEGHL